MNEDRYPYEIWVNEALQGVLRRALRQLSQNGFTGDHHLFISFDTNHPESRLPGFLRAQYPDEITIVLQHQFEDLVVSDDSFQVSLSFGGQKQRLTVPFSAVRSFADPSVNFGLQTNQGSTGAHPATPAGLPTPRLGSKLPAARPVTQPQEEQRSTGTEAAGATKGRSKAVGDSESSNGGAEVIALDTFRKK